MSLGTFTRSGCGAVLPASALALIVCPKPVTGSRPRLYCSFGSKGIFNEAAGAFPVSHIGAHCWSTWKGETGSMAVNISDEKRHPFLTDIQELRRRARQHMEQGAVTSSYLADRQAVIRILNEVLATEIVCVLRYMRHYYMATGIHAQAIAQECLEHAKEEQSHADLVAERIAVESYNEIIRYLANDDPTSRVVLEQILAKEEQHADDMRKLLETLSQDERFAERS